MLNFLLSLRGIPAILSCQTEKPETNYPMTYQDEYLLLQPIDLPAHRGAPDGHGLFAKRTFGYNSLSIPVTIACVRAHVCII